MTRVTGRLGKSLVVSRGPWRVTDLSAGVAGEVSIWPGMVSLPPRGSKNGLGTKSVTSGKKVTDGQSEVRLVGKGLK